MTQRHYAPTTPPFAFPGLIADAALGRARQRLPGGSPASRLEALPADPAAIVVSGLLLDAVEGPLSALTVMELAPGDGRCGQILARHGVATLIAVDPSTAQGCRALYADHIVGELTTLDAEQAGRLDRHRFDGLVSAAVLGAEGIPPADFVEALDHVARGGWVCVVVDASVLTPGDTSGYGALLRALTVRGVLEVSTLSDFGRRVNGETREHVAIRARKGRAVYDA